MRLPDMSLCRSQSHGHQQPTLFSLLDLPKELIANMVGHLSYSSLPAFRATCKVAQELVDASSTGWVMKVEEGEALQTSQLLHRLTSLAYVWFEGWDWGPDQEANFLAVILSHLTVFAKLQEVRFPGIPHIPLRCLRGLLAALPTATTLSLPPLPADIPITAPAYTTALASIASLSTLTDLQLEGWALTDSTAARLGAGLPRLQRLMLGSTGALSRAGYESLAQLRSLISLTASGARGNNSTLAPLTALTGLTGLRIELATGFGDSDPGPLACQPALRTLGWWHAEAQSPMGLRPGSLAPWLRELSLCVDLDLRALEVLSACSGLVMMQVHSINLPTVDGDPIRHAVADAAALIAKHMRAAPIPALPSPGSSPGSFLSLVPPVLPALRNLILGDLFLPLPDRPQPLAHLCELFPRLENMLAFQVTGRGLLHLSRSERLKRLVLNSAQLGDDVLAFLPSLPSLKGLQLEGSRSLTDASSAVLKSVPKLEQLLLLDTPGLTDAFIAEAATQLPSLRALILSRLPGVHDQGLENLASVADTLEQLELRSMPVLSPVGLEIVHRLTRLTVLGVCECDGIDKAACRELETALMARGRDVAVDYEATALGLATLADDFGEPSEPEGGGKGPSL